MNDPFVIQNLYTFINLVMIHIIRRYDATWNAMLSFKSEIEINVK